MNASLAHVSPAEIAACTHETSKVSQAPASARLSVDDLDRMSNSALIAHVDAQHDLSDYELVLLDRLARLSAH